MTRGVLLVLLAVVLAGATVGCGSGDDSNATAEPIGFEELSQAASASSDATSGRFEFEMSMSFPGSDDPFAFSGSGAFDAIEERASFTFDMSSFAALLGGFAQGFGATGGSTDLPNFDDPDLWKIDMVLDGLVMYMRFPAVADKLPDGASWVRVDAGKLASGQGLDLEGLEKFTQTDPRKLLAYLRAVSGDLETVGTEKLRGVDATHYHGTIDLQRYATLVPAEKREELESLLGDVVEQAGVGEMPFDVWLDANGLVRKLSLTFSGQAGLSEPTEGSMTFELYDYGKDVEIELPPADEVIDESAIPD